ncbi:MAG TPA: arginine--tRNA ligase, partial [Gemmatimonadaceae bacterium]|nr:arginine--tRNA ligase [Gemmatimonadaceae bacterium]
IEIRAVEQNRDRPAVFQKGERQRMTAADQIRAELIRAARSLGAPDDVDPLVERPRDIAHGDWATNLAMVLAKPFCSKPRDVAEKLRDSMNLEGAGVSKIDIAGPGFMNFWIDAGRIASGLGAIISADQAYGRNDSGRGREVNIEFVSANPTGPLHVGHGRQAALGDAIATLLENAGWNVTREFYYNDAGAQIDNLAASVEARLAELEGKPSQIPEGGYHGEYIREIAERYKSNSEGLSVRQFAVRELRKEQDLDLQAFGVRFDRYFLESSLYTNGMVDDTVRLLIASGKTYEHEGALWLRTTEFGDDKDRVMRKRDGTYTYFLPDVAYHITKWKRGFRRAIDVQGADHHSTVTRVRAGLQALAMGMAPDYPEYVLHQMVTVMKHAEEVKISKRAGSYVTVRDLINEVGRDAVRYFFLMRKSDSQLIFNVDLAASQSEENPVYYIQMAHARMCGIFRVGGIDPMSVSAVDAPLDVLTEPEEQELIKALVDFPELVASAAETLEPHRIATYLLETARLAHLWYHKHHVLEQPENITRARLALARAAQIVLRNGMRILGISSPERM